MLPVQCVCMRIPTTGYILEKKSNTKLKLGPKQAFFYELTIKLCSHVYTCSPSSSCSHIATMLKSHDYHTIVGGVQMAHILMEKLPEIFIVYFHREGVIHEVQALRNSPLKLLPTPRKETPPSSSAGPAPRQLPHTPLSVAMGQTTPSGSSHSSTRKYTVIIMYKLNITL